LTASLFFTHTFLRIPVIDSARNVSAFSFRTVRNLLLLAATLLMPAIVAGQTPTKTSNTPQFKTLSEQAAKASEDNRLDEAITLYRKALALQPRWAEGWWALGTLQYDQNRYADASRAFEKLVALKPENGTARAMLGLCQIELQQDDPALKNLSAARQLGVHDDSQLRRVVLYQLGAAQLRMRRFGDASATLAQLVKDGTRTAEVTIGLGMAALLIQPASLPGNAAPGRDVVERVGQAVSLGVLKQFEAGKQMFALVAGQYPTYPNLHYAFGRFLLDMHEAEEGAKEFQHELENDPAHLGALLELAGVRYRIDSADGVKYAERAVKLNPQLPFGHYLLGLLYLDTDRATEAIPELEIARRAFAKEARVYFALGNAYAKTGQKEQAARMRAEFVRLNVGKSADSGLTVYGDQPSGLVDQRLSEQGGAKPKQPD
jgi:tetratricopeptide (TPR) repeat protein